MASSTAPFAWPSRLVLVGVVGFGALVALLLLLDAAEFHLQLFVLALDVVVLAHNAVLLTFECISHILFLKLVLLLQLHDSLVHVLLA